MKYHLQQTVLLNTPESEKITPRSCKAGQSLSKHIAVKQIESNTYRPQSSLSVTTPSIRRTLQSKCLTFNLFYCYMFAQELPSHTYAVAMSLYQIITIM